MLLAPIWSPPGRGRRIFPQRSSNGAARQMEALILVKYFSGISLAKTLSAVTRQVCGSFSSFSIFAPSASSSSDMTLMSPIRGTL